VADKASSVIQTALVTRGKVLLYCCVDRFSCTSPGKEWSKTLSS